MHETLLLIGNAPVEGSGIWPPKGGRLPCSHGFDGYVVLIFIQI